MILPKKQSQYSYGKELYRAQRTARYLRLMCQVDKLAIYIYIINNQ